VPSENSPGRGVEQKVFTRLKDRKRGRPVLGASVPTGKVSPREIQRKMAGSAATSTKRSRSLASIVKETEFTSNEEKSHSRRVQRGAPRIVGRMRGEKVNHRITYQRSGGRGRVPSERWGKKKDKRVPMSVSFSHSRRSRWHQHLNV